MKKQLIVICSMIALNTVCGQNLIQNADFEESESGWDFTGTALHCNWRSASAGKYCSGIRGLWAEYGNKGTVSQANIPVEGNTTYILNPSLYADMNWRPRRQFMFVEYYGGEPEKLLDRKELVLGRIPPTFIEKKCLVAPSPSNAVHATIGIAAHGVSAHGGLTVDDIYFGPADGESGE